MGPVYQPAENVPPNLDAYLGQTPAGFPSPADDYLESRLDLNRFLIQHPSATFLVRVNGDSMAAGGIHSGDVLVVDRSLTAGPGSVVVAVLEGRLAVKRVCQREGKLWLPGEGNHKNVP